MKLEKRQNQITKYVKSFLIKLKSKNLKSADIALFQFTSWAKTPCNAILKFHQNRKFFFQMIYSILKDIYTISCNSEYAEVFKKDLKNNYDFLIISWSFKKNFQSNGSYTDGYFKENSRNLLNAYWLLISEDAYIPKNLDRNIKIIKKKNNFFKIDFFILIKLVINLIFKSNFSLIGSVKYLSFSSHFANKISSIVKEEVREKSFKYILVPYEAQPFQHLSFIKSREVKKNIKTIGYITTQLTPLPCDYIHRDGAPDKLMLHGKSQKMVLQSKLGWPKAKLYITNSFQYRSKKRDFLSNKIFLPYTINNKEFFLEKFEKFLAESKIKLPSLKIQNHPKMINSPTHLRFIKQLKKILKKRSSCLNKNFNKKISIFFGVTAAIFEALENDVEIIQICHDPVFESHNQNFWPFLKVQKVNEYVFVYNLTSKGKYINFKNKRKSLHKTLKTLV